MKTSPLKLGYIPKPVDLATRPGNTEDYLIPRYFWQDLSPSRITSKRLMKRAVKLRSLDAALVGVDLVDFSSSTDPILVWQSRRVCNTHAIYLHEIIFDLRQAVPIKVIPERAELELYCNLLNEGKEHLWFVLAMLCAPVGFNPCPELGVPDQQKRLRFILQSIFRWWDHFIWLNDRIYVPLLRPSWPFWALTTMGLAMNLGIEEQIVRSIEKQTPQEAKRTILSWNLF